MPQRTQRMQKALVFSSLRPLRHLRVLCVKLFDGAKRHEPSSFRIGPQKIPLGRNLLTC